MKISLLDNKNKIPLPPAQKWPEGVWDVEALKHGTMSLILYTPEGKDYQTPHDQDELYFIVKGSGNLNIEGVPHLFSEGDALFVPAGKKHRFENFEKGLTMWAVFWGAKGGEV